MDYRKINTHIIPLLLLIAGENLLQLDKYIECYMRKLPLPNNMTPIKTKKQNNNDLMFLTPLKMRTNCGHGEQNKNAKYFIIKYLAF
ncbi:hypothetical protein D7D25_08300 [Proteiniphilum sp. X52]|nr:hypothetical protein D7D25_08300 [Proteiniphilum sp. X52]